ncbi:recombinase family protein [Crateriforma conspicua]|uniref:recombinase family protein n=1 Tax=Crateriforma conspicua TaxID=2527996 RepID=UPI00118A290D|nr:recombinase family protein [Crateriforma conspicua]QDV62505.1 DNA-invertase hin [Crateriforma conspicua]
MKKTETKKTIRCAIYTRKSTEEGLDQEFNSLDAQRASAENFIASQASEGWVALPTQYDDGGFTGGNMDRPALKQMMADIDRGKIDCVVVYKVDRLSRSLLDFSRMMDEFEQKKVSFVSVTQQFNTTCSMGRLTLNILLSFAQFEREIISERTRDKIAAARRRGKWSGGMPVLGYTVPEGSTKLVVDPLEAERVRAIFDLYLERKSLLGVVAELDRRCWVAKQWTTRKGTQRGGRPFCKTSLHRLLTNVTYLGKLRYKDEIHEGEHDAIVDEDVWKKVQALMNRNGRSGGGEVKNKFGALLRGLLRCKPCDCTMIPSHSTKPNGKRYRYYVCAMALKRGWANCPTKSVPAGEIERFVVDQIRCIGRDSDLARKVMEQAEVESRTQIAALANEEHLLLKNLSLWQTQLGEVLRKLPAMGEDSVMLGILADLQDRIREGEKRLTTIRIESDQLARSKVDPDSATETLAHFDDLWQSLVPREQTELIQMLIQSIEYDGEAGKISIAFHPSGIGVIEQRLLAGPTE